MNSLAARQEARTLYRMWAVCEGRKEDVAERILLNAGKFNCCTQVPFDGGQRM